MIEMPSPPPERLIFEPFIETDEIVVSSKSGGEKAQGLVWKGNSRWVEITVGVIGTLGSMRSLSPSVTVKETGDILSLEEKFQGTCFCTLQFVSIMLAFDDISFVFLAACKSW
jgi:hypothetical protein